MKKSKMVKTIMDDIIAELVEKTDQKTLAIWAAECAERVLPYFEEKYPNDDRPRKAIEAIRAWVRGEMRFGGVRTSALSAHASAREVIEDLVACSIARAAGHAAATAHVGRHSLGAAIYAATAIRDITNSNEDVLKEKEWQYQRLLELREIYMKEG